MTDAPDNHRPYRRASETGPEMRTHTLDAQQTWRQIGWHGQTGAFYALDEKPSNHEPGSISPLWLLVDNEPPASGAALNAAELAAAADTLRCSASSATSPAVAVALADWLGCLAMLDPFKSGGDTCGWCGSNHALAVARALSAA